LERSIVKVDDSHPPQTERIALVLPNLSGGGAERVNLLLAEELLSRGYAVDLVLMRQQGELLGKVPTSVRLTCLGADRIRQVPRLLARYLREQTPSALLANMCPLTTVSIIAHRLARSAARLVVLDHANLSEHYADRGWMQRSMMRASLHAYRLADSRVAVSKGVADNLAALSGMRRSRFEVIYNPIKVSPADASQEKIINALWPNCGGKRLLTVGTLKNEKNQALLIAAFAKLIEDVDACLMILGEGELRPVLESLVNKLGVGNRVAMPGFVDDPAPFYRSANLFVLSSNYEGFGNVIVEALACGTPVVSTDCPGGPGEIVDGGRYGMLCPVGNQDALTQAMRSALTQQSDKDVLVRRASEFSVAHAADQYLNLLLR
jgi:glycosyltransferase involved in cell wall biosynthesis